MDQEQIRRLRIKLTWFALASRELWPDLNEEERALLLEFTNKADERLGPIYRDLKTPNELYDTTDPHWIFKQWL